MSGKVLRILGVTLTVACWTVWTAIRDGAQHVWNVGTIESQIDAIILQQRLQQESLASLQKQLATITTHLAIPNEKSINLDDDEDSVSWPFSSPDEVFLYLIHIGKAGGKTLYKTLNVTTTKERFTDAIECRIENNDVAACPYKGSPFNIGRRLMGHFHLYRAGYSDPHLDWLNKHTNLLLYTVRDPGKTLGNQVWYTNFWETACNKQTKNLTSALRLSQLTDWFRLLITIDTKHTTQKGGTYRH